MSVLALLAAAVVAISPSPSTPAATATPEPVPSTAVHPERSSEAGASERSRTAPRRIGGFAPPSIVGPAGTPERVVLLLADGAPAKDTAGYAQSLGEGGALVVVLDTRAWLAARATSRCAYPAGDLEVLAQRVEKERGLDAYQRPMVVGLGEGALVAWAAVAQAPPGTFAGGVALAPCPDRPLPVKLCAGSGPRPRRLKGGDLPALARSPAPMEVIADPVRSACPGGAARLASDVGANLATVEGSSPTARDADPAIAEALQAALERLSAASPSPPPAAPEGVADLPLVEVPAAGGDPRLAVLLTGDGGWVGIDKALAAAFADAGVATVGLDSLRYFWKRRTPEETARAVARIVDHYSAAWGRTEVILVGYSRGADIVPFVAARLEPPVRERVRLVAMLGPGTFAELEVHAIDLFSSVRRDAALSTEDAVRATAGRTPMLCVRGSDETDSLCPHLDDLPWVRQVVLKGGHHFGGGYAELARTVLDAAR